MDLLADLKYAVRLLRKTPVFTVAAIGTLALGIGANTTIFSLVQDVLLRPLPYQDPDQVVMVWEDRTAAGFPRAVVAPGNYRDWRAGNRSFTDMAATRFAFANLTGDGAPELVIGRRVTANFFSVLGVQPVLGSAFTAADDTSGDRIVVISHALWQRRYGGDRSIFGRKIQVKLLVQRLGHDGLVFVEDRDEHLLPTAEIIADEGNILPRPLGDFRERETRAAPFAEQGAGRIENGASPLGGLFVSRSRKLGGHQETSFNDAAWLRIRLTAIKFLFNRRSSRSAVESALPAERQHTQMVESCLP